MEYRMRTVVDVENLVLQRVNRLKSDNPKIRVKDEIFPGVSGEWGLISVLGDDDRPESQEFIESETSWLRSEASSEYNRAAKGGHAVSIIVPDNVLNDIISEVERQGEGEITVCSYSSLGLFPRPMAY